MNKTMKTRVKPHTQSTKPTQQHSTKLKSIKKRIARRSPRTIPSITPSRSLHTSTKSTTTPPNSHPQLTQPSKLTETTSRRGIRSQQYGRTKHTLLPSSNLTRQSQSHFSSSTTTDTSINPLHKTRGLEVGDVYMNPRLDPDPSTFARRMMTYWFQDYERGKMVNDACRKKWFLGHPVLDKYMVYEFGADFEAYKVEKLSGAPGPYSEIERHPLGALSLIILIQQYPKSSLRLGKAESGGLLTPELVVNSHFGPTARLAHETFMEMVYNSIQMLHPLRFDVIERIFFFLPLLQVENRTTQKIATARISDLVEEAPRMHKPLLTAVKEFGLAHLDVVAQFGRFPQRNELMGRESTNYEREYLRMHTSEWEPVKIYQFVGDENSEVDQLGNAPQLEEFDLSKVRAQFTQPEDLPAQMKNPNAWI